jgi:ribonuclease VapC
LPSERKKPGMNRLIVLDASAVLALLHREPGSEIAADRMQYGAAMSAINLAEVISKHVEIGIPASETVSMLELLGIQIHSFDAESAALVGSLRNSTKRLGLSLADRACIVLGQQLKSPVLTADKAWAELDLGIEIIFIR